MVSSRALDARNSARSNSSSLRFEAVLLLEAGGEEEMSVSSMSVSEVEGFEDLARGLFDLALFAFSDSASNKAF